MKELNEQTEQIDTIQTHSNNIEKHTIHSNKILDKISSFTNNL